MSASVTTPGWHAELDRLVCTLGPNELEKSLRCDPGEVGRPVGRLRVEVTDVRHRAVAAQRDAERRDERREGARSGSCGRGDANRRGWARARAVRGTAAAAHRRRPRAPRHRPGSPLGPPRSAGRSRGLGERGRHRRRAMAAGPPTIRLALVTIPRSWASMTPSLTPSVSPRSSALTISRGTGQCFRSSGASVGVQAHAAPPQPRQPEQILHQLERRVVIDGRAQARARPGRGSGEDRDDVAAGGEPAAAIVAGALVPGQDQQPVAARARQQPRDETVQEPVADGGAAVVHVVAQVRRDPDEAREPVGALVGRER